MIVRRLVRIGLTAVAVAVWVVLAARPAGAEPRPPLAVVASFSILADMTAQIGGSHVVVSAIGGPGGDAHDYMPSPSDARALAKADVVVINGLGFEGWFDRLLRSSKTKALVVVASDGVVPLMMGRDGGVVIDPHAWLDLVRAQSYVQTIAQALAAADPDHAAEFAANGTAYARRLAELDAWTRDILGRIAPERRRAITSHDAFGYFAHAYGIEFLAPQGGLAQSEPSPRDMARLIDQMKAQHVRAVFMENMTNPRLAQQIAKDAGGVFGGALYPDALSPPDGPAPTFAALFRHNVETIQAALSAP
jgi:zinc/manganese transport system substrate-binding protein